MRTLQSDRLRWILFALAGSPLIAWFAGCFLLSRLIDMTQQKDRRKRRWCFLDLVVDHQTGKLRESALWSNIGKCAMTWGFVYMILHDRGTEFLWLAFGGVVVGAEVGARILNQKQQVLNEHVGTPPKDKS